MSHSTAPTIGSDEAARLEAVRRYDILDTPPDGAFDRITALAARHFKVPICIVSVVDEDRIWFKSHHGLDVKEIGRDPGLCASAILQHDPWIVSNAQLDPRTLANPLVAGEFGLRFYAGAPLTTQDGHNLGTLCIIDHEPRELDAPAVATLRDMAGIVMDELELRLAARRAVSREYQLREQSEAVTHTLQQSLLPARLPTIPGAQMATFFRPASPVEVAGDFYDCFVVGPDHWALVIGDVTGKGPEAAVVTAMVRYAVRTAASEGKDAVGVLATVNRALTQAQEEIDHRYATLSYVSVRRSAGGFTVEACRGGHPPALVAHGGEIIEGIAPPSPMLGMIDPARFVSGSLDLVPSDVLVLYTDGLTEARTAGGEFVETEGVARTLDDCRGDSAEEIVACLGALCARASIRDDVAILVFRVLNS